jgi:phosphatidylserine/phosphatidylglycerophosphate/cardiolipin synthase-like enzyme
MKVIVQPDEGSAPVLAALAAARKSIDIAIFRLDMKAVVQALAAAVARGVNVRALIAHTGGGGEKALRRIEVQLLDAGATVSRSADDLVRYHYKMMVIDGRRLHVHGFNFTRLDMEKSRSFGLVTTAAPLVREAQKLFEADCDRQTYTSGGDRFVVSPVNARERLAGFIKGARRQLLIYDPKVSDPRMLRLLAERQAAGVDVRIIGSVSGRTTVKAQKFPGKRLHARAMVRDGTRAFVGSQSLRALELDRRRELGLFVHETPVVKRIAAVFEQDWAAIETGRKTADAAKAAEPARPDAAADVTDDVA